MGVAPQLPRARAIVLSFWTLAALLAFAFVLGGSSREDTATIVLLRPLSVIALVIGLMTLSAEAVARYRALLISAGVVVGLMLLQTIPLPPAIWTALPGREVAAQAAQVGGFPQPWRPIAMVPWRAWNTIFAMVAPIAALVLAVQLDTRRREHLVLVIIALIILSMLWAAVQVAAGYPAGLQLHHQSLASVPLGFFANRNHFAALLACALPLMALLATAPTENARFKAFRVAIAATLTVAMLLMSLLTGSRAGLVLACVALLAVPLMLRTERRGRRDRARGIGRRVAIGFGVLLTAGVVAVAILFARAESVTRLTSLGDDELRWQFWGPILGIVWHYFPIGSGVGSFVEVYQIGEPQSVLGPTYLNHAHNDAIEWALETGLVGIGLLAVLVFGWGRQARRLLSRSIEGDSNVLLARCGVVITFLLGLASLVDYPLRTPALACIFVISGVWMAGATGGDRRADRARGR